MLKEEPISLHQLVSTWFNIPVNTSMQEKKAITDKKKNVCPSCGFTYRQFLNKGKFGCASCYETFSEQLPQVLKRLQAGTQHVGEIEEEYQLDRWLQRIAMLREQLKLAITEERFEEAAKMRDEIRLYESKVYAGGENCE